MVGITQGVNPNHSCDYVVVGTFDNKNKRDKVFKKVGAFIEGLRLSDNYRNRDMDNKKPEEILRDVVNHFMEAGITEIEVMGHYVNGKYVKDQVKKITALTVDDLEGIYLDWEDDYRPYTKEDKKVAFSAYTSGYYISEIGQLMKKNGGKVLLCDSDNITEL